MIPKLYDSFDTTVAAAGATGYLGKLIKCTKCLVNESTSGVYTLEAETTLNDPMVPNLLSQRIIQIKPNPHDPLQCFEIQDTERIAPSTIKLTAQHVKSFACQLVSEGDIDYTDRKATYSLTPAGVWNKLFADNYITDSTPFQFMSTISDKADCYLGFNEPVLLGDILGGAEGSLLELFGGEYHFDNYSIKYLKTRGKQTNYRLRYGRNLSSAKQKETISQTYSHILPYGTVSRESGSSIRVYSPPYEIPNHERKTKKVFILDCTSAVEDIVLSGQTPDYTQVRSLMTDYALQYAQSNRLGKRNVSIDVTARADLDAMLKLGLCDSVNVVLDEFGTSTTAKITAVTYDALAERWEKMTVGASATSLAKIILDRRKYNL